MKFLKPKCYAFVGYPPRGTSLRDADVAFNNFISDRANGLVLYHDHFVDEPGAVALFFVEKGDELERLERHDSLKDWTAKAHPLTFTEKPTEFLYQTDFTMGVYRGRRLRDLMAEYAGSELEKRLDGRVGK